MKWLTREQLLATGRIEPGEVTDPAGLLKFASVDKDSLANESRRVRVIASTSAADRENDVIAQSGWKLDNYLANPVVLFGHDYRSLPVAKAVSLTVDGDRLLMECEFASAEQNPFADVCYKLVKGGYLNAVSVGFRPTKWNYNEDRKGIDFLEQELLEVSWVPVPAHPQALVTARDAGIDVELVKQWAEGVLNDLGYETVVPMKKGWVKLGLWDDKRKSEAIVGEAAPKEPDFPTIKVGSLEIVADEPEGKKEIPDSLTVKVSVDVDGESLADSAEKINALVKQGRVLSATNESKIRAAVASLTEVLGALETAADDDGKAAPQAETKSDATADDHHKATPAPTASHHEEIDITPAALLDLVKHEVRAALTAVTGRLS